MTPQRDEYCTAHEQSFRRAVGCVMCAALDGRINHETRAFGGVIRCETCGRMQPLGDVGLRVTTVGWPKCCGYTMRWWTQRQIDSGEMSRAN